MTKLKIGDTVKVHYTGKHLDGTVFDSTAAGEPIMFTIGDDLMILGFEKEVRTMTVGEKRKVTIKPDEAYGDYDKDLVYEVNQKEIFGDKKLKLGDEVQLPIEDDIMILRIAEMKNGKVKLDANSDLAGKTLIFDIELVEIMQGGAMPQDDEFASEFEDVYEDDFDDDDEFGGGKVGKFDDDLDGDFDDELGGEFDDEFSKGGYDEFEKY
jgi:FKBP-type peptidyl-prolyl cis-trans isomerase 2